MPDETPFRWAVLAALVLTMAVGVPFRWRAARSGERISHREEGYLFAVVLRLAGLALWASVLAYLLAPSAVQFARLPLAAWQRWLAGAGAALCPALMYWTLRSLGRNLTDTVVTRQQAVLVTHGPYRWVRHPFYVVAGLLMACVSLLAANWLILACSILVLGLLVVRTPQEERLLVQRFGTAYTEYRARTGRFFPRWFRPNGENGTADEQSQRER